MCDEDTEAENATFLKDPRLNRREVGIGAGALVAAVLTGCARRSTSAAGPEAPAVAKTSATAGTAGTASRMVTIDTPDGAAEAFFVAPTSGRHPGVILWPDVAGLREAYETMATRLAESGYAVLAVNQYYRSSKAPVLTSFAEWTTDEGKAKLAPMRAAITPDGIARDGAAFAAWLDQQREVDPGRKLATTGYCMGGPFTFRTAAAAPDRVGVIASFHGGGLVTDEPTSPHALLPRMKVAALICIAQNDDARDPAAKDTLQRAAAAAHVPAEVEVYPAQHGWCTLDSPVYDHAQAERAWARMLATFERHL
ncbi:MAG: dienelactone hydrolase family protein [Myxococcales bacterium]|nr:dienelactone hydrolase family protein [Myxococcales bacterium]